MLFCTRVVMLGAVCVVGMMLVCVHADHYTLDYECQQSGNMIIVQNPDIGILKSATAGTEEHLCNVTVSNDTSIFTVTGCQNEEIQFTLSTRQGKEATGDGIIGGSYSETYVLVCLEINDEGVVFNASLGLNVKVAVDKGTNGTNATTHAPWYSEEPVTPSFSIASSIWNSDETQQVTNANVGDLLKWKVQGPYEYDLLPFTCTVNPGNVYGTPPVVSVIQNGCSAVDMVTNFESSSGNPADRYIIVSDLYAFKFTMSDELTFACSVKICTKGNGTCIASCGGRKRRALADGSDDMTGVRANVFSHLTIGESSAISHGLSYILLISTCIIGLGQNLFHLKI